jgi:hypothetical protein
MYKTGLLSLLGFIAVVNHSFATHLRAGEITIERKGCGLTFDITLTIYTNTGSPIRFGDGVLDFGDGSAPFITPTIQNTDRSDLGPNIGLVVFTTQHTYAGGGTFVISYLEANRNEGIKNMANSVQTRFYIESKINIDNFLGCDNSPRLLVPPIDKGCKGVAWYHNPGAYDPDGDSLSFELTIPKKAKNVVVDRYQEPNNQDFYIGIVDYKRANEAQNDTPKFSINSKTGTIVWDAPGLAGEYNIAFVIKEWRKVAGVYLNIGYVVRDMQIVIEDCGNKRPELGIPEDVCVVAGESINKTITGTDPDFNDVKIEAFSQVFSIQPSPATYKIPVTNTAPFQPTGSGPATLDFAWKTTCDHVKEQPYQVVFKITDKPKSVAGPALVQFKTWNITVIGPAPTWKSATVNTNTRRASLEWNSYACKNATAIQVYRRVNSYPWSPSKCVTGIPDFLGFTKIADVSVADARYTDTNKGLGLAVGAQYCYRLVAIYPSPGGGTSIASNEICLDPILGTAPIITNVTIDKTDKINGQVTVKWRSPLGIDKARFPSPYNFTIYRSEGFSGNVNAKLLGATADSTWVDKQANTSELIYNYKILPTDANAVKLDTSASASTVRLDIKPRSKKIELSWNAFVPWNNRTFAYPRHAIYRASATGTPVLIDSVDVNQNRFQYLDSGQYNKTPLKETDTYCYYVVTKGSYGNKKLPEPLLNASQIICGQPIVNDPPCAPKLSLKGTDCTDLKQTSSCEPKVFSNTLFWNRPTDPTCRDLTATYNIYIANTTVDDFVLYKTNVRDTFFVDSNLPSFARCYKITAVNRSGIESEKSNSFCFDNCPHYELPNVFTPNGDPCNEKFSAYSDRDPVDENGNGPCGKIDVLEQRSRCARFVEKVVFTVVNRWGKEVYTYESGGENSIYIDWDGKDNNGKDLSAGVYFYFADVTFNVVDPSMKKQKIKGWVQIIR